MLVCMSIRAYCMFCRALMTALRQVPVAVAAAVHAVLAIVLARPTLKTRGSQHRLILRVYGMYDLKY